MRTRAKKHVADIRDVASLARVSVGTVSNVLNNPTRVRPSTALRVQDAIQQLGFVPNNAARQLGSGTSRTMGLIVPDIENSFYLAIARSIQAEAAKLGFVLIIGDANSQPEMEDLYFNSFEQQRLHGIIATATGESTRRLSSAAAYGVPSVMIACDSVIPSVPSVGTDHIAGGEMAAGLLIAAGYRRLAFVRGAKTSQLDDVEIGARHVVSNFPEVSFQVVTELIQGIESGWRTSQELVARSPEDMPDAILAREDVLASGLVETLRQHPSTASIAVVSCGAVRAPACDVFATIQQPGEEIGRIAFALLEARVMNPEIAAKHVLVRPSLILRQDWSATAFDGRRD